MNAGTESRFNSSFSAVKEFFFFKSIHSEFKEKKGGRIFLQETQVTFLALLSRKIKHLNMRQTQWHNIQYFPQHLFFKRSLFPMAIFTVIA